MLNIGKVSELWLIDYQWPPLLPPPLPLPLPSPPLQNVLVAMNAEGVCFIFAFNPNGSQDHIAMTTDNDHTPPKVNNALSMKPSHTQDLHSPNVKVLHIADIGKYGHIWSSNIPLCAGAEGMCDLFVGHTDRVVAVYRWSNVKKAFKRLEKFTLPGQVRAIFRSPRKVLRKVYRPKRNEKRNLMALVSVA